MAYITFNSWLRAEYGKRTRRYFAEQHQPLRWLDLGKDVFDSAIVDSGVLLLRTGGSAVPFPSVDRDTRWIPRKSHRTSNSGARPGPTATQHGVSSHASSGA